MTGPAVGLTTFVTFLEDWVENQLLKTLFMLGSTSSPQPFAGHLRVLAWSALQKTSSFECRGHWAVSLFSCQAGPAFLFLDCLFPHQRWLLSCAPPWRCCINRECSICSKNALSNRGKGSANECKERDKETMRQQKTRLLIWPEIVVMIKKRAVSCLYPAKIWKLKNSDLCYFFCSRHS